MKKGISIAAIIALAGLIALGFQNCSEKNFYSADADSLNASNGGLDGEFESGVIVDGNLVQIQGHMAGNGGQVSINGVVTTISIETFLPQGFTDGGQPTIVINGVDTPTPVNPTVDGRFRICAKLNKAGNQNITITQENGSSQTFVVQVPTFTTHISVSEEEIFGFVGMSVLTSSSGTVTVSCIPGSTITAEIYGVNQTGEGITCTQSGEVTFNVTLVPKFANTGNRIVTVTQTLENGFTTTISADIDNTVTTHQCTITGGGENNDICVNSAGTLDGTCKAGLPIKVYVDDQLQDVDVCKQDGTFSIENVLLPLGVSSALEHRIRIEQDSPFAATCSDEAIIQEMIDLTN